MMRVIFHTAKRPYLYKTPNGETIHICMCGLSQTYPICHGDHAKVRDEDENKIFLYDNQGSRLEELNENNISSILKDVNKLRKV
ncbi:MAG: hypothetical protein QW128_04070 [Thermoprotei archaeon]